MSEAYRKMKRNWLILAVAAAAILVVVLMNLPGKEASSPAATGRMEAQPGVSSGEPNMAEAPKKGWAAPAFTLAGLDGGPEFTVGGKRDKPVIVNFWASWCGPCDLEAPDLVTLYDRYKDRLDLYAVNVTKFDKVRNARQFVQEKGFRFPVLSDAAGDVGEAYKVYGYPTSFIIGRDGQILQRIEGVISLAQWEKYLDEIN
jgi:cytochrome c biogenesis protein CcmG/thiol:disulfide interchange protein DsbE